MAVSWNAEEKQACLEETLACFMYGSSLMSYIRPPPVPQAGGCPVPHWAVQHWSCADEQEDLIREKIPYYIVCCNAIQCNTIQLNAILIISVLNFTPYINDMSAQLVLEAFSKIFIFEFFNAHQLCCLLFFVLFLCLTTHCFVYCPILPSPSPPSYSYISSTLHSLPILSCAFSKLLLYFYFLEVKFTFDVFSLFCRGQKFVASFSISPILFSFISFL